MREIKFRAWNNCRNEYLFDVGVNPCVEQIVSDGEWADEWDKYVIEQFTGLRDKNGKEIYEGDIVDIEGERYVVVFWQNGFYAEGHARHLKRDEQVHFNWSAFCETNHAPILPVIIGNIHENHELLEDIK